MGVFTSRRSRATTREEFEAGARIEAAQIAQAARSNPRVLRASGVRIQNMSSERLRALASHRQAWQEMAWGYRDMVGELRAVLKFRANAISRVQFFAAEIVSDDDEPIALSLRDETDDDGQRTARAAQVTLDPALCQAAEEELARLPLDSGYQFLGVWIENFDVAGECWLHGRLDPTTGEEIWQIRSVKDVHVQGTQVAVKDDIGQLKAVDTREGSEEALYRLWVPHPASPHLADSALNACMDSLEDVTLIGREMRATSRSRIAANGVMLIPEDFLETPNTKKDDDGVTARDQFMADFTAMMLAPIQNEGDPGAVVPAALFSSIKAIDAFRHIRFDREDSPTLIAKLDRALTRMAQSLDIPPEIVTGLADANHWSAWQIDASTFRHYLEPAIRLMADSLTVAYLRAALISRGFAPAEVKRVRIWYDAGQITENPNRRQDALDAYDRMAIGGNALRNALGFNDGDEATSEERLMMVASKQGMDTSVAATILAWAADKEGMDLPSLPTVTPTQPRPPAAALPAPPADETGVGGTGTPDTAPTAVAASAAPPPLFAVDLAAGELMASVERALLERIVLAADSDMQRALDRAGSRLRSKATRDHTLHASLRDVPVKQWAMTMGREQALAVGGDVPFLLRQAWEALGEKFASWVTSATETIIAKVLSLAGLDANSPAGAATAARMRTAFAGRIDRAWNKLTRRLDAHAEKTLFNELGPKPVTGEVPDITVPPRLIRDALAEIGGMPETSGGITDQSRVPTGEAVTGLVDGTTVVTELAANGVHILGREWRYNPALMRDTFHPHWDLHEVRFTSWQDPKLETSIEYAWIGDHYRPGDHLGCMCSTVAAYLAPVAREDPVVDNTPVLAMLDAQMRERLAQPSQYMAELIVLAESDDRAGRYNTTAQQARNQWLHIQRLQRQYLEGK